MNENKVAKIPVASHGLHKHSYNYPWLSSLNFGDVMPCYINTIRKGERDNPKAGVFSQLMPIAHNAFATGRYNFKAIFVPYKLVWRPWYAFDQQTEFVSNGQASVPSNYPFVTHSALSSAFVNNFCTIINVATEPFDIKVVNPANQSQNAIYRVNDDGRPILRILGALGCVPSFVLNDIEHINILPILCYLKAYYDYYFPNNYVGGSFSRVLTSFQDRDTIDFSSEVVELLGAIGIASEGFYENSVFDLAWDNPTAPNALSSTPRVSIHDITNDTANKQIVSNDSDDPAVVSPVLGERPTNGTAYVGGSQEGKVASGVLTQYVLNALKSVSMWAKRRQLSGARLLDRFLVSRGITLGNDSARISYFIGERNIEIQVSGVENNTDTNLGELAGRGVASSGNEPLSFECRPDDDGIFLVVVSAVPDANFPVLLDGFACRRDNLDNYNAEYDKLGAAAVPARLIRNNLDGMQLEPYLNKVFGFLNRYWDEVQERPRLLGDFILRTQGSEQLRAYHTFRILSSTTAYAHSYEFIRMADKEQYNRLFYSSKQENLMLFLRWYGDQFKEKLPLGDSYEWDDDELNRKVSVVVGGSQK